MLARLIRNGSLVFNKLFVVESSALVRGLANGKQPVASQKDREKCRCWKRGRYSCMQIIEQSDGLNSGLQLAVCCSFSYIPPSHHIHNPKSFLIIFPSFVSNPEKKGQQHSSQQHIFLSFVCLYTCWALQSLLGIPCYLRSLWSPCYATNNKNGSLNLSAGF